MAGAAQEAEVARLAAAQHGVVTALQLQAAGFGRSAIARRLAGAWLVRLHEGVYQVGVFGGPFAGEAAALLACGPWAAIGRRSALIVHGLPGTRRTIEVTIPHAIKSGRPGIRYHRVAALPDEDVTVRHGLRVTTPARTLVDLAAASSRAELERLVEELQVQRLATPDELREAIRRAAGRPGIRKLRAAAELSLEEASFTRSEAERRLLALIRAAGLPMPQTNVTRAGWEVDAVWDRQRLVVEVDGFRYHGIQPQFERDRRKDAQLQLAGYRVLRITWRRITREPETVIATIAAMLAV